MRLGEWRSRDLKKKNKGKRKIIGRARGGAKYTHNHVRERELSNIGSERDIYVNGSDILFISTALFQSAVIKQNICWRRSPGAPGGLTFGSP